MKGVYNEFWTVVADFQTLIAAVIGLAAVVGAIYGIRLQAKFAQERTEYRRYQEKQKIAQSIYSLLRIEKQFSETSIFTIPSKLDVEKLLADETAVGFGINDYIDYVTKSISALSQFPEPISDRSSFVVCCFSRLLLAKHRFGDEGSSKADLVDQAQKIIASAVVVLEQLNLELSYYVDHPMCYESLCKGLSPGDHTAYSMFALSTIKVRGFSVPGIADEVEKRLICES